MTDQNQINFTIDDLAAEWGEIVNRKIVDNLLLEKRIKILEISNAQLQAEIDELQPLRATVSREAAELAEGGREIIQENQKAAR